MEFKRIEINTDLTREETDVIETIEKMESEIEDLGLKQGELEIELVNLIYENPIAILKHDLAIMEKVYDLLGQLKGTYDSDNDLEELSAINWEMVEKLRGHEKDLPEGTIKEEIVESI